MDVVYFHGLPQFLLHVGMPGSLFIALGLLLCFLDGLIGFVRCLFLLFSGLFLSFNYCIVVSALMDRILAWLLRNLLLFSRFHVGLKLSLKFQLRPILALVMLFPFLISLFLIVYSFFELVFLFFLFNDSFFIFNLFIKYSK